MSNSYNCILLVDDDAITNEFHKDLVKKLNRFENISSFNSSTDALSYLKECVRTKEKLPSVFMIGIMMPVIDGFELMDELNEMYEQHGETDLPKFIIVSSPNHNRDQEKFVLLPNKKAYIIKPMDKSKLEAAMDSIEN